MNFHFTEHKSVLFAWEKRCSPTSPFTRSLNEEWQEDYSHLRLAIALILILLRGYRMLAGEDGCPGKFTRLIQVAGILLHHTIRLDKWNQSPLAWLGHLKMLQNVRFISSPSRIRFQSEIK